MLNNQLRRLFIITLCISDIILPSCGQDGSKSKINATKETVKFLRNNSDSLLGVINLINLYDFPFDSTNSKRLTYTTINEKYFNLFTRDYSSFFMSKISSVDIENFNQVNNRRFAFILKNLNEVEGGIAYLYYDSVSNHADLNNTRISKKYLKDNWYFVVVYNF